MPLCLRVQLVSWYDNEWGYSNRVSLHSPVLEPVYTAQRYLALQLVRLSVFINVWQS